MEVQVEVSDDGGRQREYVGIEVCRGPGVLRVILTRPYRLAGQTINVPLDQVESVKEVESGLLGEPVREADPAPGREETRGEREQGDDHLARTRRSH